MKRNILSALLIMLGIAYSNAQPGFESFSMNNQLVKDLSGYNWKMKMMRPGEGEKQGIHKIFPEDIETLVWNPAKVPGDVYTDLWKAGAIDDPYFGRNSVKAQWVQHNESVFQRVCLHCLLTYFFCREGKFVFLRQPSDSSPELRF